MELTSIINSQVLRFSTLAAPSLIFLPDLVRRLQEEFRFAEVPAKAVEFNTEEGMTLKLGFFEKATISQLKIYRNGMLAEGPRTTEDLEKFLDRVEKILGETFGATYTAVSATPKLYFSSVECRVLPTAVAGIDVLKPVRDRLTAAVRAYGVQTEDYDVTSVILAADQTKTPGDAKPQRFVFERRAAHPFESNLFYSEAPLTTREHLALLLDLEATLTTE